MKYLILFFLLTQFIFSCSKSPTTTNTSSSNSMDSLKTLGTWYYLSLSDSLFNLDGSFNSYNFYIGDTAVIGYKQCNYVTFQNNGTYISGSCAAPGPNIYTTYYNYISDSSFSETYGNIITGLRSSGPAYDTVRITSVSSTKLVLYRIGNKQDLTQAGFVTHRHHSTEILTK